MVCGGLHVSGFGGCAPRVWVRVPPRRREGVFASPNTPSPQRRTLIKFCYAKCPRCGQSARRRALTKQSPPKPLAACSSLGLMTGETVQFNDCGIYPPRCCSEDYLGIGFGGYTPAVVSTDCPWRRAVREVIGKVLSRNLFELRDASAQRVLRRLANCRTGGVSRRSGLFWGVGGFGEAKPPTCLRGGTRIKTLRRSRLKYIHAAV